MFNRVLKNLAAALFLTLGLTILSLLIWLFKRGDGTLLQEVLFIVGALPVVVFSIRELGQYFRMSDPSCPLHRSVHRQLPDRRGRPAVGDLKSSFKSGISWVLAGLVILLICYGI